MKFEPLIVRVVLATPWALPLKKQLYPLHLDALVVSVLAAERGSFGVWCAGFDPERDPFAPGECPEVPLAVAERHGVRIYQASAAMPGETMDLEPTELVQAGLLKRAPHLEFLRGGRRLEPVRERDTGWGKGLCEERLSLFAPEVLFHCVGDAAELASLLSAVRALGSGRNAGFGQVARVEVLPARDADPATWGILDGKGRPVRCVPVGFWPEGEALGWRRVCAAAKPPYWHPARREMCWAPKVFTLPDMAAFYLGGA